jgi:ABC-type glycerol-3-phosphate transport system permease component
MAGRKPYRNPNSRYRQAIFGFYLPLLIIGVPMLFPLYWLVASALKTPGEVFAIPPTWYPHEPTLQGFRGVFQEGSTFIYGLRTSLIVAGITSILSVSVALCSGYALARFKFPFRYAGGAMLLFTQLFPVAAILIPLYIFWSSIGLHSSYTALIVTYLAQAIPITTWLVKGYVETIPIEMEQQAWIDGASRLRTFLQVVLPLAAPAIGATAMLAFVGAWNEFVFAMTLTGSDPEKKTLPVAMIDFMGQHGIMWDRLMAAATIATIPAIILFFAAQRFFVRGLTAGAVKG